MKAYELGAASNETRDKGWSISGRSPGLGIRAWALAVIVVAVLALGLAFLHG